MIAKHPHHDFLRLLSNKCLFNIFGSDNVSYLLHLLTSGTYADEPEKDSCVNLLLASPLTNLRIWAC